MRRKSLSKKEKACDSKIVGHLYLTEIECELSVSIQWLNYRDVRDSRPHSEINLENDVM